MIVKLTKMTSILFAGAAAAAIAAAPAAIADPPPPLPTLTARHARPQLVLRGPVPRSRVDLVRRPVLAAPQPVFPVARSLRPGLAVPLLVFLATRAQAFRPRRLRNLIATSAR